jgi:hypothetical protein
VETRYFFASGEFVFCSQWLPPLTNKIWHCDVLEVLLASSEKFRFTKAWGWKSMHISINHADVGGCSNMTRVIVAFFGQKSWLVDLKVLGSKDDLFFL